MSTMEAEQQKLNYPKCVCVGVCAVVYSTRVCVCVSVCSLPRFSTDDVISYICIRFWMSITSLIPLAASEAEMLGLH